MILPHMFHSFTNYIFFWQMCGFTHIFRRSAVVSNYCKSLLHLQQCIIRKMRVYYICFASQCHRNINMWLTGKHEQKQRTQCLLPLQTYLFLEQMNFHAHIYWRGKQSQMYMHFLLQFTTVCNYIFWENVFTTFASLLNVTETKISFLCKHDQIQAKMMFQYYPYKPIFFLRQKYFLAYIYWRVVTNAYFFLPIYNGV